MQNVIIHDLGRIEFSEAWRIQQEYADTLIQRKRRIRSGDQVDGEMVHYLLICEHEPVFTLGKTGKPENLLISQSELKELGIGYHRINRGGDITYHGPGQIIVYPIFDLDYFFTDVHKYVRFLEEAVIRTLGDLSIAGERIKGYTGVWLKGTDEVSKKICAIGVHLSRWVTMHGLAFNVNTDLSYFDKILPCGIDESDKEVTSLADIMKKKQDIEALKLSLLRHFSELFEFEYRFDTQSRVTNRRGA